LHNTEKKNQLFSVNNQAVFWLLSRRKSYRHRLPRETGADFVDQSIPGNRCIFIPAHSRRRGTLACLVNVWWFMP